MQSAFSYTPELFRSASGIIVSSVFVFVLSRSNVRQFCQTQKDPSGRRQRAPRPDQHRNSTTPKAFVITIEKQTLALISITASSLDVLAALYLAHDLLGGEHGALRTLPRAVPYGTLFGWGTASRWAGIRAAERSVASIPGSRGTNRHHGSWLDSGIRRVEYSRAGDCVSLGH